MTVDQLKKLLMENLTVEELENRTQVLIVICWVMSHWQGSSLIKGILEWPGKETFTNLEPLHRLLAGLWECTDAKPSGSTSTQIDNLRTIHNFITLKALREMESR